MIVAGFGFRQGATMSSLQAALTLAQAGSLHVTCLATLADKAGGLLPLAEALGVPMIEVPPEAIGVVATRTQSAASLAARETGSVAEACALAAAGPGAGLLGLRQISPDRMATCAIAQGALT